MATLTSSYQFINRSSVMKSQDGTLSYYLLLYAKTTPNNATGIHTVSIKTVLASTNNDATFYLYTTSYNGKINSSYVFTGTNKPKNAWEMSSFTENGVKYKEGTLIGEGSVEVDCTNGLARDVDVSGYWKFNHKGATYTPANGTERTVSATVTLSAIPRRAELVSAPNFSDGDDPTITYSNPAGTAVDLVEVGIYDDTGYIAYVPYGSVSRTGTSYTFNLTDAERETLLSAVTKGDSISVKFYIRTTINDTVYIATPLTRTFTILNANPVVEGSIQCDDDTYDLTGDRNILIKYFSSATASMVATEQKGATIDENFYIIRNGDNDGYGDVCTFENVENPVFTFSAEDDRGNIGTDTVTAQMVDYIKLTCSIGSNRPDALGNMTVTCVGDYFNDTFGAQDNTLTAQYRYKVTGGTYSGWKDMTVTKTGNRYSAYVSFVIPDYEQGLSYTFQTRVSDRIFTENSNEFSGKSIPAFHWGEDDFAFEVPVAFNGGILSVDGVGMPSIEYGVWKPELSTSAISSYTAQNGWYAKIGQNVTVGFFVKATCRSGYDTTDVVISGLPFSPMSTAAGGGMCSGVYVSAGFNFQCFAVNADGTISTRVQACNNTAAANLSTSASGCRYRSGGGDITLGGSITYKAEA